MAAKSVLTGNLSFLTLADLLQLLGGNGSSGILRLRSPHSPEPGLVYFRDGNPVHAVCPGKTGIGALHALFGWVEGEYAFSLESFSASATIKQSRMEIILDGLRMLDDGEIPKLGPGTANGEPTSGRVRSTDFNILRGPLVDYMSVVDEETFSAGQQIVEEGSHGNWIWVILEGKVDLFRGTPDGPHKLLTLGEGAFVGSVAAFTISGHIRSATCVAATSVVLGVLDMQRMATEYTRMSQELRTVALSMEHRLRELTERVVEHRQGPPDPKAFLEGFNPVMRQGDADDGLYRVTSGRGAVVRQKEKLVCPLARLEEGDVFGRIPFADMGQEPASAMVLGDEGFEVARLDAEALRAEFDRLSQTFKNLFESMASAASVTALLAVQGCARAIRMREDGDAG